MTPFFTASGCTVFCGDCLEILPQINDAFDLVIADPPYTTGIASFGEDSKASGWGDIMNSSVFNSRWLLEAKRVTAANAGAAFVFNGWRSFPILVKASFDCRWPIKSVIVWDKKAIGPAGKNQVRPTYEQIALFPHKDFVISNRSTTDIWPFPWGSYKPHGHPAEKPSDLIRRIIRESGARRVLDPFCGSGTVLEAAIREGCEAVGIESDIVWCEKIKDRIKGLKQKEPK